MKRHCDIKLSEFSRRVSYYEVLRVYDVRSTVYGWKIDSPCGSISSP